MLAFVANTRIIFFPTVTKWNLRTKELNSKRKSCSLTTDLIHFNEHYLQDSHVRKHNANMKRRNFLACMKNKLVWWTTEIPAPKSRRKGELQETTSQKGMKCTHPTKSTELTFQLYNARRQIFTNLFLGSSRKHFLLETEIQLSSLPTLGQGFCVTRAALKFLYFLSYKTD